MPPSPLQYYQTSIAKEFFVDTADHNYVTSRWAFHHGLILDFYWNANHAVEKYLKASLVLNGNSSIGYRHNVTRIYRRVLPLATSLIPPVLSCPSDMDSEYWINEETEVFIKRLNRLGAPDGRYAYYSYDQRPDDMAKVDSVVFALRRLTVGRDWDIGNGQIELTYRKWLASDPSHQPHGAPNLPSLSATPERAEELQRALYHLNFAFRNDEAYLRGNAYQWSDAKSWFDRFVGEKLHKKPPRKDQVTYEALKWIIDNITLKPDQKKELQEAASRIKP